MSKKIDINEAYLPIMHVFLENNIVYNTDVIHTFVTTCISEYALIAHVACLCNFLSFVVQ